MARIARIKAEGDAFYHVVSRIANRAFLLNNTEKKRIFVNMMHRAADFSGVDVITYVVMDNHFHLCVRVSKREGEVPESEVLRRVGSFTGRIAGICSKNVLQDTGKRATILLLQLNLQDCGQGWGT